MSSTPWTAYAQQPPADGPWAKYGAKPPAAPTDDPLKTGAGMEDAAHAQARPTSLPEPKPGLVSRIGETVGLTQGTDPATNLAAQAMQIGRHPVDSFVQGSKQLAMAPVNLSYQAVHHPLDTAEAIMPANRAIGDARAGNYGAAAGDLIGGFANTFGLAKAAGSAKPLAEGAAEGLNRIGAPSSLPEMPASQDRALGMYRRAVAPTSATAEDRAAIDSEFTRGAKYIGDETGPGRQVSSGEGGVGRSADRTRAAKQRLWDTQVQPHLDSLRDVQRPGNPVADEIRSSFTDLDRQTKPSVVSAGERFASSFDRPMTVGQMEGIVKQLNADKSVSRFYNMTPGEQSQAELADPSLRAKVAGLESLRGKLFDAVSENAGEGASADFQSARRDYGALSSMEQRLRDTRVPTPQSLPMRAVNTVKSMLHPGLGSADTLLGLNDPNRLVTGSFNMLGRAGLDVPDTVEGYSTIAPPSRQIGSGPIPQGGIPYAEGPIENRPPQADAGSRASRLGLLLPEGRSPILAGPIPMDETPSAPGISVANDSRASRKGLLLPENSGSGQKLLPEKSGAPQVTPLNESLREMLKRIYQP